MTTALVLLDLDGTLIDSTSTILQGIRTAFSQTGLPEPSDDDLVGAVGPNLRDTLLGAGMPHSRVDDGITLYRRWYVETGIPATTVFDGVPQALSALRSAGCTLVAATSKLETVAERVTAVTGLDQWLDGVFGTVDDEDSKATVIGRALAAFPSARPAVMVGDRVHDSLGAAAHGVPCLLVSWGAAPDGELEAAVSAGIVRTVEGLAGAVVDLVRSA